MADWIKLLDISLSVAIASGACFAMFRLYERTEKHRRDQFENLLKLVIETQAKATTDRLLAIEQRLITIDQRLTDRLSAAR